jgi:hypothetical protein
MQIKNESSLIEFEFTDSVDFRHDVACRIKIFCDGFSGQVNSVWFSEIDINSFIKQLETLDETRKGSAELLNMSSGTSTSELDFLIFSIDSLGHLAVRATLRKQFYLSNAADLRASEILKTTVAFEIDPSSLSSMINDFKKLFYEISNRTSC